MLRKKEQYPTIVDRNGVTVKLDDSHSTDLNVFTSMVLLGFVPFEVGNNLLSVLPYCKTSTLDVVESGLMSY